MASVLTVSPVLLERYMSAARQISRLAVGDPTIGPAVASRTYTARQDVVSRRPHERGPAVRIARRPRGPPPLSTRRRVRHQDPAASETTSTTYAGSPIAPARGTRRRYANQVVHASAARGRAPPAPISYAGQYFGQPGMGSVHAVSRQGTGSPLPVRRRVRRSSAYRSSARQARWRACFNRRRPATPFAVDESRSSPSGRGGPAVESVAIDGPYDATRPGDTPSRSRLFVCRPASGRDEDACAKTILSTLARRAYRRPVTDEDIQPLLEFLQVGPERRKLRRGHPAGRRAHPLRSGFPVPDRARSGARSPPASAYRISDLELASRLSFFLWSSIPDDELLDLAARGRLKEPAVLERQVRRMLADSRSKALVDNFAGQWLSLRDLQGVAPNPDLFPEFDENLREAFRRETELFVESQLRDDRSVVELLTADYTFVNERLARHYEIPECLRESLPARARSAIRRAGGLLGQGSILTVTSYGNRTSPVLARPLAARQHSRLAAAAAARRCARAGGARRGRQADVGARADGAAPQESRPARRVMCAWIRWGSRSRISTRSAGGARPSDGTPIDASGVAPRRHAASQGVTGLRTHLVAQREDFAGTVTEKLLTYALGRGRRVLRSPGDPQSHARGRGERLSLVVDHSGDRQEHAISDAEVRVMIVTKKAIARRTVLRGIGATLALPLLDSMVPALTALGQTAARRVNRLGVVYVPNGIEDGTLDAGGRRRRRSSSRRFCSRSTPFRDRLLVLSGLSSAGGPHSSGVSRARAARSS